MAAVWSVLPRVPVVRPPQPKAGLLTGTTLMCQCHGSKFDVTTGSVLQGPATKPLATYEVREENGNIEVCV